MERFILQYFIAYRVRNVSSVVERMSSEVIIKVFLTIALKFSKHLQTQVFLIIKNMFKDWEYCLWIIMGTNDVNRINRILNEERNGI